MQRGGLHVLSESGASFRGRIPLPTALIPPLGSKAEDQVPKRRCLSSSENPGPREEGGKASHAKVKGRFTLLQDPGQEEEVEECF